MHWNNNLAKLRKQPVGLRARWVSGPSWRGLKVAASRSRVQATWELWCSTHADTQADNPRSSPGRTISAALAGMRNRAARLSQLVTGVSYKSR